MHFTQSTIAKIPNKGAIMSLIVSFRLIYYLFKQVFEETV